MKRFKEFSNRKKKNINPYSMVHGSHAQVDKIHEGLFSSSDTSDFYPVTAPKKPGLIANFFSKIPKVSNKRTADWIAENDNSHIGKDLSSVHQALTDQTGDIRSHPNFKQLNNYTLGSRFLNDELRDHGVKGTEPPERISGIDISGLDDIVNSNKTQQKMTVYHGTGFNPLELAQHHPNLEFSNPGYTSTSIDKQLARNFGRPFLERKGKFVPYSDVTDVRDNEPRHRHVMSISVPEGHSGAYVGNNTLHEHEFLLPRDTTFRLRSATPRTYTSPSPNPGFGTQYTHVWDTEIVPQGKE